MVILPVPCLFLWATEDDEGKAAQGVDATGDPEYWLPVFNIILTLDNVAHYHGGHEPHSVT